MIHAKQIWNVGYRWSALIWLFVAVLANPAGGQAFTEPVVARMHMKFTIGEEVVNEIQKGELLTVIEEQDDAYVISTLNGQRGLVEKVNAARLAESVEIYSELIEENPEDGLHYTMRASAGWARGDESKALADYDQAISLG